MRKLILLVSALLASTFSVTYAQSSVKSVNFAKSLGSAWTAKQTITPTFNQNDIAMVYGGADISRKPTLIVHTATA